MEVVNAQLRTQLLDAVRAWVADRYGARIKDEVVEHARVFQTSSESGADYIVHLDILDDATSLRLKVLVAPDGRLQISD